MSHKGPKCGVTRKLPPNCEGFPTSRTSKTEWMAVSCSKIASLPADDEISKEDPREICKEANFIFKDCWGEHPRQERHMCRG